MPESFQVSEFDGLFEWGTGQGAVLDTRNMW